MRKNIILPKIQNKLEPQNNRQNIINLEPINSNKLNPLNNIKSKQNNTKQNQTKSKYDCIDAEEYLLTQYPSIPDVYDLKEFNSKLDYLKKILLNKNIFVLKTGWETVWDNLAYSQDKAGEMILARYPKIVETKYNEYDKKYNLSRYNYPKKIMYLLYMKNILSFLYISDYLIFNGKIIGLVKISINFINDNEKNIIISCVQETFPFRYNFDNLTNTLLIQLKKK